ncbi:MAG: HEAT repeat domain-containing protein [Telluria sp.]
MSIEAADPLVRAALWGGLAAFGLTGLVLLQIVLLRLVLVLAVRREQVFLSKWRPLLLTCLSAHVPVPLPPLAAGDRVLFLRLWVQLLESVRGASPGLELAAKQLGCVDMALEWLEQGNPARQMLATVALGHLRDQRAWPALLSGVDHDDASRSFASLRALVQIDGARAAPLMLPLMLTRAQWPIAKFAALMAAHRDHFGALLAQACGAAQGAPLQRALRLAESLRLPLPSAPFADWLGPEQDPAVVVAALRNCNMPLLLALVRPLLAHADWRVRVQAAKVLGRIGEVGDEQRLIGLLSDVHWWVRYRAAQALHGLPFFDHLHFAVLAGNASDRFARDMLAQVMAEGKRT